jgi:hypothetical protein
MPTGRLSTGAQSDRASLNGMSLRDGSKSTDPDPRWTRFLAAPVKAVMIQKLMRWLQFDLYIPRFGMPTGCIVPPDSQDSIIIDFGT